MTVQSQSQAHELERVYVVFTLLGECSSSSSCKVVILSIIYLLSCIITSISHGRRILHIHIGLRDLNLRLQCQLTYLYLCLCIISLLLSVALLISPKLPRAFLLLNLELACTKSFDVHSKSRCGIRWSNPTLSSSSSTK